MTNVVVTSDQICVRRTELADLEYVRQAEQHPENAPYVDQWSLEEHQQSLTNPDHLHLLIESADGERVGYIIMAGITNRHGSIEFKRFVITEKGQGYGQQTFRLIKKYVFEELGAHRMWLDVREKNQRAQQIYLKEGFQIEGKLREAIIYQGEYESVVLMAVLAREYREKD